MWSCSQEIEEDPIGPFEEDRSQTVGHTASKKRRASAAVLGASPKAKSQRGLDAWVRRPDQTPPPKTPLTAGESEESFQASFERPTTKK